MEEANRLRKAEEEEIAQLKRALSAAKEDNRQGNMIRERSSGREEEFDKEEDELEDWGGNTLVDSEAAVLEEEKERPDSVRRNSKVKKNTSGSLKGRPVAAENFADASDDEEDLQSLHSMSMRSAEALSGASLRVQETEDLYTDTDEENDYGPPPARKSPKIKRRHQSSSSSSTRPSSVNDLMAQFQGFAPRSSSPIYMLDVHLTYGNSSSSESSIGYGAGIPGLIVNAGIGNINTSTISNVGNVKKVHRK